MDTNIRGIEFKFNDECSTLLKKLLLKVDVKAFDFCFGESTEIFFEKKDDEISIKSDSGFFPDILEVDSSCYVYFLSLYAYPINTTKNKIETYEEFVESNCQFIILVSDGWCIEIYAKDKRILLQFIRNAIALKCENIMIKTDYADGRTRMSV